MRIQLLSDLHLERQPDFVPRRASGCEVLVLAGDIGSYQSGSLLTDDDFGLSRFAPAATGWKSVFFVPGNHEYDDLDHDTTRQRLRTLCDRLGITWLDREIRVLDGVRFIGTTLWSDFDALGTLEKPRRAALGADDTPKHRLKAFRAADFYLRKHATLRHGERMLAASMRDLALDSQAWLREALAQPFDGKTVVVTHFAPSLRSSDPRYGLVPGTAGFCNALDGLLPFADVWIHGHLHCAVDYLADGADAAGRPHSCRVVANPLGYDSKGEQAAFDPCFTIDI